ncbi:MAG: PAS domain-containing protein [Nitrospira sp.]
MSGCRVSCYVSGSPTAVFLSSPLYCPLGPRSRFKLHSQLGIGYCPSVSHPYGQSAHALCICQSGDGADHNLGAAILVRNYRQRTTETARLAALVTSSDDAILSTTLEGKIETWNAGAEHLCAYQAAEIMGQPLSMLLPEDRQAELADMLARVKNGEHNQPFETVWTTKDHRVRRAHHFTDRG